jgi:ATPase subunit of ABC transporter with duplicated ATPase domains
VVSPHRPITRRLQFEGSVIAVSHDRYFLRRIATRILLVEDRQIKDFEVRCACWVG